MVMNMAVTIIAIMSLVATISLVIMAAACYRLVFGYKKLMDEMIDVITEQLDGKISDIIDETIEDELENEDGAQ